MKIFIKDFKEKVVLVTGGSSGIGLATARLLARQGAHVWLIARGEERLSEALRTVENDRQDANQRCGTIAADVSNEKEVNSAISKVIKNVGLPDLVINSAGVARPGYVQDIGMDIFHWMMDTNYFGTVHVIKALLPGMIKRSSGYIVNISSMAGFLGVFGYTAYGASKYAVRGFSDVLRAEMKPHGIGVSIVYPPDTNTAQLAYESQFKPMESKALTGSAGMMTAEAVADAIIKGIMHGHYVILPGMESKLFYRLSGLAGNAVYPVMDLLIAQAQHNKK
jgi:3-dehydrosphinganine reductase